MASRALFRLLKSARVPLYHENPLFITTRTYVTPVRTWTLKTQKALASTVAGAGNPNIVTSEEGPPTRANNGNSNAYETGNGNGNGNGFGVEEGTDWSKSYYGL